MQKYELLYVLPPHYTEAELPKVQDKVISALRDIGAVVARNDHAGKLKPAYPINGNRFGHYYLAEFEAEKGRMKDLNKVLTLTPEVIRFQLIRAEEGAGAKHALISFEDAVARARALRDTIRSAAAGQPEAGSRKQEAGGAQPMPTVPHIQLSEEEIEKKIEKLLSEDEIK